MRLRCHQSATVPACAVTGLVVLLTLIAPAPVGLAQSAPPPLTPWRGLIDHASVTAAGGVPTVGVEVARHAISGDGRFVVMQSLADTLVADDFNWAQDIFLRDRQTGVTTRLSVSAAGGDADGFSDQASISTDGRHVVFTSAAINLVEGDTNGFADVFVRDLELGRTVRVSLATDGTQTDSYAYYPSISANGRFVAFVSDATTLAGRPQYAPMQVYVHDRDADGNGTFDEPGGTATTLESVSSAGDAADNYSHHVRISGTGRFVLFESSATNLDPVGNPNSANHVYLRDRQAGTTELIDRAMTGGPSTWGIDYRTADMSDDGRYITYATYSQDIVVGSGSDWNSQVIRYDTGAAPPAERTSIVSVLPDGTLGNGYSFDSSVSADGRYIVFRSTSTNLASPAQPNDSAAVFVRDMASGTFTRVDVIDSGEGFDHTYPYSPSISADGTAVAFMSDARNAVGGQYTFGSYHAFVATAFSVSPASATLPMAGGAGAIEVNTLPVAGWNAASLDTWIVLTAGGGYAAGPRTVEYSVEANPAGILRTGRILLGSKLVTIQQEGDGDTTPPVITPTVTGTLSGSGWYTSDITVQWSVTDPESEIVSVVGCYDATFTTDFVHASPMCEASSHGGSASVSFPLRRDTTPPSIAINAPLPAFYPTGTNLNPHFTCSEPSGYAGVASCTTTAAPGPLDTTSPGRHAFTVNATDQAGNAGSKTVEYVVGTGACVAQPSMLKAWWRFNGNMYDTVARLYGSASVASGWFENAVAGQGWVNGAVSNYLDTMDGSRLLMSSGLTVALWVKPLAQSGQSATLVTKPAHYRIARYLDGTLRWAFSHSGGYTWVDTGAVIPSQQWSHVAVSYDNGLVKSYLNGTLVHTQQVNGSLVAAGDPNASLTIGGRADLQATLHGSLDDVQIYDKAISAAEIEAIALAGSGSLCVPNGSTLTVSAPSTIGYGATFRATAVLRDGDGNPLANRQVWLNSHVAPGGFAGGVSGTTDATGSASADLPVSSSAALGYYARAVSAVFEGDVSYRESSVETPATLAAGTPVVTWPPPAPVVYGTALGAQLNASASEPGSFSYAPAAGTILDAGTHTLSVTFTPTDTTHWAPATSTATLIVDKATPVVTATGGTFTYDNQPHPGSGSATGVLGETLSPVQLTYNGSTTAPMNAGEYAVEARFEGSTNYTAAWRTTTLTILKKAASLQWFPAPAIITYGTALGPEQLGATADVPGTFTYSPPAGTVLAVGTHVVSVTFVPTDSANYSGSSTARVLTVSPAPLTIAANNASKAFGAPVPPFSAAAAGFVNGDSLASLAGTLAFATTATASSAVGTYPIVPQGVSSPNYTIAFVSGALTVVKAATALAVVASPNPSGWNQPVTYTASVAVVAPGAGSPTGSVQFFDGGTLVGTAALVGGSAALTTNGVAAGSHTITATYSGDASFLESAGTTALTVRPATASSTTSLTSSRNPASPGQSVTFRATVTAPSETNGGIVEFYDGAALLGTGVLSSGLAQLSTTALTAGGHAISARYAGNASVPPSASAPLAQTIGSQSKSSSVAVTVSPSPAALGSQLTITAVVTGGQQKAPTGQVLFLANGQVLDQVTVTATGTVTSTAALQTSALPRGTHTIVAVYLSDQTFRASTRYTTVTVN